MKSNRNATQNYIFWLLLIPIFLLGITNNVFAASTGEIHLLKQSGSGYVTAGGDYISSNGGLNAYYRYFIEVPPGTARLTVEIYDADIGAVTTNYTDWVNGSFGDTSCNYSLRNPAGTSVASQTYSNTQAAADSTWTQLYTVADPTAGHWELRVNMSSSVTSGNDYNGYGIRAHDGIADAGGSELNIYAESFLPIGHIGATGTSATTAFYPYVTSGCTVDWNDFDGDNGTNLARLSYRSRNGTIPTTTYNGSANDVWGNRAISGYSTDNLNEDSGIWTASGAYTTLSGSTANFGVFWAGNWQAVTGEPYAQPQANSFRVYLPTDGGGAPEKPYLAQKIVYVSGPNPPHHGNPHTTTYMRVIIDFHNPAARAVTFSASNQVTAYVPGGTVLSRGAAYAGVSQGTFAVPAAGSGGNITWNPGTVAAGATVTMYYQIGVTPTANGRIVLTGTPAANGTSARYVDETGNTTQARATFTFGPLCELAATEDGTPVPTWVAVSCLKPAPKIASPRSNGIPQPRPERSASTSGARTGRARSSNWSIPVSFPPCPIPPRGASTAWPIPGRNTASPWSTGWKRSMPRDRP